MNIKRFFTSILSLAFVAITLSSCVHSDDWETPPINCENKFASANISMADFIALAPASGFLLINDNKIFDGYVVSSDENGNFTMQMPVEGIYQLYGKKENYFSQTEEINASNYNREKTLYVKIEICAEKVDCGKAIGLKNILFDLNKFFIREDAKPELNKLVRFMTDNPEVKVELSSHTDCRASNKYNQTLSQNRANESVAYIVSQGIAKEKIVAKGYGETKLVNECADGINCTEEQHQANRRTEFKVICPEKK